MPVNIISRELDSPFNTGGNTNDFLIGNVGDWLRTRITFEAGFYFKTSQNNPITLTPSGEIQRNSGSWIEDDGFEIGDSVDITIIYYSTQAGLTITVTDTRTIDDISDTIITLDAAVFNSFNYSVTYPSQAVGGNPSITAISFEIKTDKTPQEIELRYNQFPNSEIQSSPQQSIIDGNENVFIRQSVDGTLSTMVEVGNKSGGAITTAQCRFVSKTDVFYEYEILINHAIWGYFDTLGNFVPNLLAPDYYAGAECLTDNFEIYVKKDNNDPNVVLKSDLTGVYNQKLGNTGFFDENFNGQPNNYEITTFSWEDTSANSIDGLAYNQNSVLKITVNSLAGTFSTSDSKFSFFINYLPQVDTDWKNKKFPFQDMTVLNNLGIDFTFSPETHSASPISGTLIGFTHPDGARLDVVERQFEVINANTLEVTLTFSPNASLQLLMEQKDTFNRKWLWGVSVGTDAPNVASTDRVTLKGLQDAIEAVTPIGEFSGLTKFFTNWEGGIADPLSLVPNVNIQPKDDIQFVGQLFLDTTQNEDLTKIESRIDLYETATGGYTELDSIEIDVTNAVVTPNNVQQINQNAQRGFNYPTAFKREQCFINRDSSNDIGAIAAYQVSFAWRQRYEEWLSRTGLPSAMYDANKPNDGLNNFWRWLASGGGVGSGFELRHSTLLYFDNGDVYRNPTSLNDFDYYVSKQNTHRIRHYNEAKTTNLFINTETYTAVDGTPFVVNNNAILNNDLTRISALFESGGICPNVEFAEISIEVRDGAGFKTVWKIRTDQNPVASNNPLQPLSGQNNIVVTYPSSNQVEIECLLDYSKLPAEAQFELSAQIKTADNCGCNVVTVTPSGADVVPFTVTFNALENAWISDNGEFRIVIGSPLTVIERLIGGVWVEYATMRNTLDCPEYPAGDGTTGWLVTIEGSEAWESVQTSASGCECIQFIDRILGYGTALQLPQDDPEERKKIDCCPTLPVFASETTNDPFQNDWSAFMERRDESNYSIDFFLINCSTGEEIALTDDTLGVYYEFGSLPNGNNYKGFYLDWQKVLINIGVGRYQFAWNIGAFGSTARKVSCKYQLKHFSEEAANKTVRIETIMDGVIEETGFDYRGTEWKNSLRFYGYFGKEQPTYEIESVKQTDNNVKPIRSMIMSDYLMEGHLNNSCVTNALINYHLRANNIFVTDYNLFNHRADYKGFPVRLKSTDGFEYVTKSRDAKFNITFEDAKLDRIKSNCGVDDIFPASGAPQFTNAGGGGSCDPANYIIELDDGTFITQGSIPSGGSETIILQDLIMEVDNIQVIYVGKHGNNSLDGKTVNKAVLTVADAITKAAAQITGPVTDCKVLIVDGGTYTENLTVPEGVHIEGIGATIVGNHTLASNSSMEVSRLYKNVGSQEIVDRTGGGHAHVRCHIADGRGIDGTITGNTAFRCSSSSGILHVQCDVLFVAENQIGITDGGPASGQFGHVHFRGSDIYLAGDDSTGALINNSSSKILITVDHILESGNHSNTRALVCTKPNSEMWVNTNQIAADTAWSVTNERADLYIQCLDIAGTKSGPVTYIGVGNTDEDLAATGIITLDGNTHSDAYYSLSGGVTFDIDSDVEEGTTKVYNLTVVPNGNSFSIPVGWEVYGAAFDTAATNNLTVHINNLPTTGEVVKVFIDQPL